MIIKGKRIKFDKPYVTYWNSTANPKLRKHTATHYRVVQVGSGLQSYTLPSGSHST